MGGTGALGLTGSSGSSGASGALGASGSSGSAGATGSSGAQGFFKNGTSILFGNCSENGNRPPLFLCEAVTIGRSYICLETTNVHMCLGAFATTPRDYFGRAIVERLNSHAVRAPGDCTDLEPCWQFQGDMKRGFYDFNDYLMWLLVISLVLLVAVCVIVWMLVMLLTNNRKTREQGDKIIEHEERFAQIQAMLGGQGIGEPGSMGPPDLSAYGYQKGGSFEGGGGESSTSFSGRTSLMPRRMRRQDSTLKLSEDGSVVRVGVEDADSVEARIASNSGWGEKSRLSGMNTADMAMQATVGNTVDEPEVPKPSPVPSLLRSRLMVRTYSERFGQGLQIDSYSGDSLRQIAEEEERTNEEPMVL